MTLSVARQPEKTTSFIRAACPEWSGAESRADYPLTCLGCRRDPRGLAPPAHRAGWIAGVLAWATLLAPLWSFAFEDSDFITGETIVLPSEWSIREELRKLEKGIQTFNGLIQSLGEANRDLQSLFKVYEKDPSNAVLVSMIEKKMAVYAGRVLRDFDQIIVEQDVVNYNFRSLGQKLGHFSTYLGYRIQDFDVRVAGVQKAKSDFEQQLVKMAVRIKESDNEQEIQSLKHEFSTLFRRFRIQNRYLQGYTRHRENYQKLTKNLGLLVQIFGNLQVKFADVIMNMEAERRFLLDSILLQEDSVRVKQLVHEGLFGGERAIKSVSEKLATLYLKVDAFNQLHDKINRDLGTFVEGQQVLLDVSSKIDQIGVSEVSTDLDEAIKYFYEKSFFAPGTEPEFPGDSTAPKEGMFAPSSGGTSVPGQSAPSSVPPADPSVEPARIHPADVPEEEKP